MQRHHLLPSQLLRTPGLDAMFERLHPDRIGFDDFRRNGLLLPASEAAAMRVCLPLHRGPHRHYNAMVAERVGQIEAGWASQRLRTPGQANRDAAMRLGLLQGALRRRLLATAGMPLRLNSRDPFRPGQDFAELDAMADSLWRELTPA